MENTENTIPVSDAEKDTDVITAESKDEKAEIIGVTFRSAGKIYYFDANGIRAHENQHVIVDTARGYEYGKVALSNRMVPVSELVLPLRKVLRVADKNDDMRYKANCEKENEAFNICLRMISDHGLDMKLIDVEYTFDNAKLLFYFTSEERVDFRELVKDLASVFRTRIELRQIGLRDETKIIGGYGICGREFCCHSFLGDFVQVSIKMAKEQNLSLNSSKISGACGRLMCCLRYEHETYQEQIKKNPKVDSAVITPDGPGTVVDVQTLAGLVKVRLDKDPEGPVVIYDRGLLKNKNGEYYAPRDGGCPAERKKNEGEEKKDLDAILQAYEGSNDELSPKEKDNKTEDQGGQSNKNRNKNRRNKKKSLSDKNASHRNTENGDETQSAGKNDRRETPKVNNTPKAAENTAENDGVKSEGQSKKKKKYHRYHRNNKGQKPADGKN